MRNLLVAVLVTILMFSVVSTAFARGGWEDRGGVYGYRSDWGRHGGGHRGGGDFLWGMLAGSALTGFVGAMAYPYYSYRQPVCEWVPGQPVFDVYGRYIGTTPPARVCQQY